MSRTAAIRRALPVGIRMPAGLALLALVAFVLTRSLTSRPGNFSPVVTDSAAIRMPAAFTDFAARGVAVGVQAEAAQARPAPGFVAAQRPGLPVPARADAMIIRNGSVVIEVDSLERAIERVRRIAASVGGSIGNLSMHTGEHQVRGATIEIKVPAARFDETLTGLSPLGEVEQSNAAAQDVGEEYVDIEARVSNAKRLEERLINLLATRTGRLEDVLAVERELARVREEIERYEGRLRYLASRAAISTIVASLHEPEPLVASPGTNVIGQAFRDMWRNFVGLIAAAIESLGVLVPVALLAWAGWRATRRWRTAPAHAAPAPTPLRDTPA